jgi:hypothetical protein
MQLWLSLNKATVYTQVLWFVPEVSLPPRIAQLEGDARNSGSSNWEARACLQSPKCSVEAKHLGDKSWVKPRFCVQMRRSLARYANALSGFKNTP